MAITGDELLEGLVQHSMLPVQKAAKEELPPIFSSEGISRDLIDQIAALAKTGTRKKLGFDAIEYRATRFNNVPRLLSIPHPKAYIDLAKTFADHWDKIEHITRNVNSMVKPRLHDDGRIIVMDYETRPEWKDRSRKLKMAFGNKFVVRTDISSCYPSLYSHALPWALVGFDEAKQKQGPKEWFNQIDAQVRNCKRKETAGVLIGPATSNIACEIILEVVDRNLRDEFDFIRFIDDYTCYCPDHSSAESFVRRLSEELARFKMSLNINKTVIEPLPQPLNDHWVGTLRRLIPDAEIVGVSRACDVLDAAVRLQREVPGGSVLKFAAKSLVPKVKGLDAIDFTRYLFKLAFYYPILIPVIEGPMAEAIKAVDPLLPLDFEAETLRLLADAILHRRSDSICWLLYYQLRFMGRLPDEVAQKIIDLGDSMSMTLLIGFADHMPKAAGFFQSIRNSDLYALDSHWMLGYELFARELAECPYQDGVFAALKEANVSFLCYE